MKSAVIILALIASSTAVRDGGFGTSQASGGQNELRHFDHVLIIVLENQSYVAAIKDEY
jgi:hypothetical protein